MAFKAAHKLGNPIDAIETSLGSLKIRIKEGNIEEAMDICEEMKEPIEEAKLVIAQFKSLTKFQQINREQISIKAIIKQSLRMAKHRGVDVKVEVPEEISEIAADPNRMIEVFRELVVNSLQWFDKDERRICVKIERVHIEEIPTNLDPSNEYMRITFADNGRGIPHSNKDSVFAPFTTANPHGAGLGLAMVRKVIEAHDGMISEEGKFGEGAKFVIILPIVKGGGKNA